MAGLQRLHLERTGISDAGLAAIASLPELEYLNLYGTPVTDTGIAALQTLPRLKQLYVWQTKVTPAAVKALAEARTDKEQIRRWEDEIEQLKSKIRDQQLFIEVGIAARPSTNESPVNTLCPSRERLSTRRNCALRRQSSWPSVVTTARPNFSRIRSPLSRNSRSTQPQPKHSRPTPNDQTRLRLFDGTSPFRDLRRPAHPHHADDNHDRPAVLLAAANTAAPSGWSGFGRDHQRQQRAPLPVCPGEAHFAAGGQNAQWSRLCRDTDGNIYFTFEPEKVEDSTRVLVRFDPDCSGATLLGSDNALAPGVPHGLNIRVQKEGKAVLYHANNDAHRPQNHPRWPSPLDSKVAATNGQL